MMVAAASLKGTPAAADDLATPPLHSILGGGSDGSSIICPGDAYYV